MLNFDYISRDVVVRNPFRVVRLPSLCQRYLTLHYHANRSGFKGLLKTRLREWLLCFERRCRGKNRGVISLTVEAEERHFSFNPLNTQFHSVYAPPYVNGYESETGALIDILLPVDGVLFDVGANWGHFSLFAASRKGFRGTIHAFEPMPATFNDLQESVNQTRLEGVIQVHNLALSDTASEARMIIPDGEHSGLATISSDGSGVPMCRAPLDSLSLPKPDVIKIDVEGHEAAMLRGAVRTIAACCPMILFESTTRCVLSEISAPFIELKRLGYRFFIPAFVRTEKGNTYLVGYGDSGEVSGRVPLALVPLDPQTRLLMSPQFNVLACHESRLMDLKNTFQEGA